MNNKSKKKPSVDFMVLSSFVARLTRRHPRLQEWLRRVHYYLSSLGAARLPAPLTTEPAKREHGQVRRILIDATGIQNAQIVRGIQRVAWNQMQALLQYRGNDIEIIAVIWDLKRGRLLKSRFDNNLPAGKKERVKSEAISVEAGDVYFTSNVYLGCPFGHIQHMRSKGLQAVFTIYDLIPIRQPGLVPRTNYLAYRDWLRGVLRVADQLVCISRTVANDLTDWLGNNRQLQSGQIRIDYCYLGVDHISKDSQDAVGWTQTKLQQASYYIMVGAIEPRKGYQEAISTFDKLWSEGFPYDLVIVGRLAGLGSQVLPAICSSPYLDRKLRWYERCDDLMLSSLYQGARCLIANSRYEGFGLPVVEAARYGVPVLARDIPVFREVCGDGAFYFNGDEHDGLYHALQAWEGLRGKSMHPLPSSIQMQTWSENAARVVATISTAAKSYARVGESS